MPRKPTGERAMTDAERQRKRRERLLHEAADDDDQRERLWKAKLAAKRRYDTLAKAVGGETEDETRARLNRGARYVAVAEQAWVEDHPGHSADREPLAQELAEAHQENARLNRRIKELEAKLARRAAKPAGAQADIAVHRRR